ncbi:PREDICTED: NADH dehydrogenase [ubiquinone] 1 alpha subcomplex subunit 10, mitochondrial [Nanorana parkeri]|uniref:NADH dehydrogenase [ubiquinone] 1 alpha subcomplex subunit 10, mitochondrial n=1 Tax=Nanorana parkeri TaxID=125878 RepID=UPI000853F6E6|nr:PREDICTED: NADH dehydrogenase [ubiquinone] 1 alpha subcomplex subunit 10, mitochondrial [Nanorana parkeri]
MFGTTVARGLRVTWKAGVISVSKFHASSKHGIQYGFWAYMLGERTTKRFGPNSKIVTVDGNLASGKGKLAKELAQRLGMKYFPEADQFYLDKVYGDGKILPTKFCGIYSLEKFYEDPKCSDGNSYRLQNWMFSMRMLQYADALEHLLSTGQGVILERSPYSDCVFLEAMLKNGYIRPECVTHYNEAKNVSIDEFLPPHIAIYVDVPAAEVYKKIQEKGDAFEKKVALSYLESIEDAYKTSFLPKISETTEVLQYTGGDALTVEQVAEDVEYTKATKGPWLEQSDVTFHHLRILVQDKAKVANLFVLPSFIPEVTVGGLTYDKLYYQYHDIPGKKYAYGFNNDVGDKYIWLK